MSTPDVASCSSSKGIAVGLGHGADCRFQKQNTNDLLLTYAAAAQGKFKAVMVIVTPCRSDMSAGGLCRRAHLADGRCHLALVRACTVWQYLRFLSLIPHMGAGPTPSAAHLGLPSSGSQPQCYNHDGGQSHVLSLAGTTRVPLSRNTYVQAARAR